MPPDEEGILIVLDGIAASPCAGWFLSPERYIRFGSFKSGWLLSLPQAKVTKLFSSIAGGFICLASCGLASRMREAVVEAKNHGSSLGLAGPMTGCRETLP